MSIMTTIRAATAALLVSAGAASALPMPSGFAAPDAPPVVSVHLLHTQCMFGSVTPSGTGDPTIWHKTAEAGVHTACTPPQRPGGGGKLQVKPNTGG